MTSYLLMKNSYKEDATFHLCVLFAILVPKHPSIYFLNAGLLSGFGAGLPQSWIQLYTFKLLRTFGPFVIEASHHSAKQSFKLLLLIFSA